MAEPLPTDIPTLQEILSSKHILHQHRLYPQKVVRVRNYAIKMHCADESFEDEPKNLRFLSQYPGLRVPKIYAAFEDSAIWPFDNCTRTKYGPDLKVYYLILDFIPGDTLENRAPNLSPEQHVIVQQKLREQFQILRSIKLPEPYFGEHGKRPYPSGTITRDGTEFGPYVDEESLIRDIANAVDKSYVFDSKKKYRLNYANKVLRESSLFRGFSPTLTHGDLQDKNIMITVVGKAGDGVEYDLEGEKDDIIVTLIDWENMLWLPEWYQYCRNTYLKGQPWWNDLMREALGPWYAQLLWWKILVRGLFG